MSAGIEEHDVDPAMEPPVLQAIDAKIAEAEALAGRYRMLRRLVAEALELNVGQLTLDTSGLDLPVATNGHETSEPSPDAPADVPAVTPSSGGAEADPPSASAGSEDAEQPKRQGGGLGEGEGRGAT